jgi:hypothetical protein
MPLFSEDPKHFDNFPLVTEREIAPTLKNMNLIQDISPTLVSQEEIVRSQLYYGNLSIISKADDIDVINNFLDSVYQDTRIRIPMEAVPNAPIVFPKRRRTTKKQSALPAN